MFIGCQFSLYPMTDRFVDVILNSIEPLRTNDKIKIKTDDISTLVVGSTEEVFDTVRQCYLNALSNFDGHLTMNCLFSRGCPGEPGENLCIPEKPELDQIKEKEIVLSGEEVAAQFSVMPMGDLSYMEVIYAEIDHLKKSPCQISPKNFCTRLDGDVNDVFHTIQSSFSRVGSHIGHVVINATFSSRSPSPKGSCDQGVCGEV